jgi:DNA-directed RNA polymerase specialized sigma24 family protein
MSSEQPKLSDDEKLAWYARILKENNAAIMRIAWGYFKKDEARRKDLAQDIKIAILTGLDRFRGDSLEKSWVKRIAINQGIKATRVTKTEIINFEEIPAIEFRKTARNGSLIFASSIPYNVLNRILYGTANRPR